MADRSATEEPRLLATDFSSDSVHLIGFDPTSARLAVTSKPADHVLVFDVRSGRQIARLGELPDPEWLGFLSAQVLLVICRHGCVRCDLRRDRRVIVSTEPGGRSAALSPGGRVVAIGTYAGLVLYDDARWTVLRRLGSTHLGGDFCGSPRFPTFSRGGRYLAADLRFHGYEGPGLLAVWDARDGRRYRTLEIGAYWLSALTFRGGTLGLALASYDRIDWFDLTRGDDPTITHTLDSPISALRFRGGSRTLEVLHRDGRVVHLQLRSGRVVPKAPAPPGPELFGATPNGDWSLLAAPTEGGVVVWPVRRRRTGRATGMRPRPGR